MLFFLILIIIAFILFFYFINNTNKSTPIENNNVEITQQANNYDISSIDFDITTKNYSKIPTKEEMVELIKQQNIVENLEKTLHKKFTAEELANEALKQIKQSIMDYFLAYNCNFLKFDDAKECFNDNICPYCGCKFNKVHDKKFKCDNCQNEIFVKTSLFDKNKLYLNKNENKRMEAYKHIISERKSVLRDLLYSYEKDIINIKNRYAQCTEQAMKEIDFIIGVQEQAQLDNKKYGLYRNTILQRYFFTKHFLFDEFTALAMFFSVVILDINNANNTKPYFSKTPNIFPKIKDELINNMKYNKLKIANVREVFFSVYSGTEKTLQQNLPYDAFEAWNILEVECFATVN